MDDAVAYASGLRELADWMDEHPELASSIQASGSFYIFAYSKDEFRESARALGGHRAKNADDNWFNVEREFGPVKLQVTGFVPRSARRRS